VSRWSYSRITTYEKCPRAYRYKYIDREKEAFESIEAFMGSRVHETIEYLYGAEGRPVPKDEALKYYATRWDQKWNDRVRVVREGETAAQYLDLGADTVAAYYPRFVADELVTRAIEHEVQMALGGKYEFHGYIDRCARDRDGVPWIIDYKTGKNAPAEFIGKEADQVRAYGLAMLKSCEHIDTINLRLDFVRAGAVLEGAIARSDMDKVERQLVSRIEAAEVQSYSTRVSRLCDWCGYNDRCEGPRRAKEPKGALPF